MPAYAVKIKLANAHAIASEGGRKTDLRKVLDWLEENGECGYFVRDPSAPFDCDLIMPMTFTAIYEFVSKDVDSLFREVARR